jgi:4-amino-4-deoxy-L-arabinose transferase-like glycosyltransferase
MFGYNGFGRLTGNEAGSVGGGGAAGSRWGPTGWSRLFGTQFGGEISWLLPAALLLLVVGVVMRWRAPRTDRARAAFLLWGGWLVVTGIVFSFSKGIIHPYYAVALAPPVGAIVGMGAAMLWRRRGDVLARGALAVALAATALWSYTLLGRTPDWNPGLRSLALVAGLGAAGVVLAGHWFRGRRAVAVAVTASVIGLVGPGAYSVATANTAHSGAIPSAGPAGASRAFGGGGPPGLGGGAGGGGFGVTGRGPIGGGPPGGGPGGLLNGSTPDNTLVQALESNASRFTWVAATVRSNTASGYQLATNEPVMAIGGFNGTDPAPTLSQFEHYVAAGQIHYFIAGGGIGGGGPGGAGSDTGTTAATQITAWVTSHFAAQTVGGVTLYDLTQPVA